MFAAGFVSRRTSSPAASAPAAHARACLCVWPARVCVCVCMLTCACACMCARAGRCAHARTCAPLLVLQCARARHGRAPGQPRTEPARGGAHEIVGDRVDPCGAHAISAHAHARAHACRLEPKDRRTQGGSDPNGLSLIQLPVPESLPPSPSLVPPLCLLIPPSILCPRPACLPPPARSLPRSYCACVCVCVCVCV